MRAARYVTFESVRILGATWPVRVRNQVGERFAPDYGSVAGRDATLLSI